MSVYVCTAVCIPMMCVSGDICKGVALCLYVFVYQFPCMYVNVMSYFYVRVCVYACIHVCIHICVYVCFWRYLYGCGCECVNVQTLCPAVCICICISMYVCEGID
jgi:hypothetical protein